MPADPTTPACCPPHFTDTDAHFRRWQAHVDAGRLGHRPAPDPAFLANRARTEAILAL